jgi:hypothetical protein
LSCKGALCDLRVGSTAGRLLGYRHDTFLYITHSIYNLPQK